MTRFKSLAIGLGVFGLAFFLGLLLTFPMGLVGRIVEAQAEKALGFQYDVTVGGARMSLPLGLVLSDVVITPRGPLPAGEVALPTQIDRVRGGLSVFPLLVGSLVVNGDIRIGDGRIRIRFGPGDEHPRDLLITFEEVPLARVDLIRQRLGMPMQGDLTGTISLQYDDRTRIAGGTVELAVPGLVMGPGVIKSAALRQVGGSVPLTLTDLGGVLIDAQLEGSSLTLRQVQANGRHVQLDITGQADLRDPIRVSRVDASVRLALDSGYVEENGLGSVIAMSPLLQTSQTSNGYLLRVSGLLSNLRTESAVGRR